MVQRIIEHDADDFTWGSDFTPEVLSDLMRHGFLTMAIEVGAARMCR